MGPLVKWDNLDYSLTLLKLRPASSTLSWHSFFNLYQTTGGKFTWPKPMTFLSCYLFIKWICRWCLTFRIFIYFFLKGTHFFVLHKHNIQHHRYLTCILAGHKVATSFYCTCHKSWYFEVTLTQCELCYHHHQEWKVTFLFTGLLLQY